MDYVYAKWSKKLSDLSHLFIFKYRLFQKSPAEENLLFPKPSSIDFQ
jgi:hypothetical protein